jgi:hypothetical protein
MRSGAQARTLVCVVLAVGLAAACGGRSHDHPVATASSSGPTTTAAPTGTPAPRPSGLRGRLLEAEAMPGFNAAYRWTEATTGPEDPGTSLGTCQRFAVTSIGAERALVRRYRPADASAAHDRAGELVARFPDPLTARRALAVLEAWRTTCRSHLRGRIHVRVGAFQEVPVVGGRGGWYLLTYGPVPGDPHAGYLDAQGMAVVGPRLALVSMVLAGEDDDHAVGHEPVAVALRRAAQRLH